MKVNEYILSLILLVSLSKATSFYKKEDFPEITSEAIAQYQAAYIKEENLDQKKYIEPIIKPEKFDLNKDRKISRNELIDAIVYVIYSNDSKKNINIPKEVKVNILNNIKLFVSQIPYDFLTFKQFSHLMSQVSLTQFFDIENTKGTLSGLKNQVEESEGEL